MLRTGKLTLGVLTAALLGMAVSNASANRLSSNEVRFRIVWTSLEFSESAFGVVVRCPVTLEDTIHSATITKVRGALMGYIDRAEVGACTGGGMTVLREALPWHLTYEGFLGTLPRITALLVLLVRPAFRIEATGLNCLAQPQRVIWRFTGSFEDTRGAFKPETLTPESEPISCGLFSGRLAGGGSVTRFESTQRILIRLI